ncbi:MAG: hypothetical protein OJF51_004109 [Nitrospira sp.]|nr:MAG: hypothetical protein OJF51_004109 [Nitrospira sp.]
MESQWQTVAYGAGLDSPLWELFHENSKLHQYSYGPSDDEVAEHIATLDETLEFNGYPSVPLPTQLPPMSIRLDQAIRSRRSRREMLPEALSKLQLASLLYYGYGVTRKNNRSLPRALRVVPSAGALYPLEVFCYVANIRGITPGIYHYNPTAHHLRQILEWQQVTQIRSCFVQNTIPQHIPLLLFITALFPRSTFKYGNRGYRFTLLEAGHAAQNINLVCTAHNLACVNIGGFYDRKVDSLLGVDGITHSTLYMIGVGRQYKKPRNRMQRGGP